MNSTEVTNSPPLKDETYNKTASLLKVLEEAPQTPTTSVDEKHTIINDINDNSEVSHVPSGRGAYIPYAGYEDIRNQQPVELQVTNLDQNIEQREMKRTITQIFREHVPILHVSVFFQSDGNMAASVRVPTSQDAQYAISQLHRKKVGFKRILISRNDGQGHNPLMLRSKVMALLAEVPGGKLQLFKFREMFEKRYHDSIGVSDLYKMKDVVTITEEQTGRMVHLHMHHQSAVQSAQYLNGFNTISRTNSPVIPPKSIFLDSTTCPIHTAETHHQIKGWAEKENDPPLPNVVISLSVLGPNIKKLIKGHGGSLPLATLKTCYEAEFEPFENNHDDGVPLEHLVTAIVGISIQTSPNSGIKILVAINFDTEVSDETSYLNHLKTSLSRFSGSTSSLNSLTPVAPSPAQHLGSQLALFSRELVDLLKTSPGCRTHFHKFIPMYHHFFGRQCRVADYGYTKLKDLFEALPHVVQIIGEGSRAMITLSHRAQVKRFTSDLLKILKCQPSKEMALSDLPTMFEKCTHKVFKISDYGVCEIKDMMAEMSETCLFVISTDSNDDEIVISIPKREQTNEEVCRTQKFSEECIELLRHVPDCRLAFNKFIPAYHHHFGRQCRVADYGFTKLIELFEAIPTTIELTEDVDGERLLQLTDSERLKVVGDHIGFLIKHHSVLTKHKGPSGDGSIKLKELPHMYLRQYGYALRPENFGESTLEGIIEKLDTTLKLDSSSSSDDDVEEPEFSVKLIDRSLIENISGASSGGSRTRAGSPGPPRLSKPRAQTYVPPKRLPPQKQYEPRSSMASSNGYGYRSVSNNSWMQGNPRAMHPAPRSRPIPQMRFTQPPPNFSSGLGYGGSSGPGCGGGDFWEELAKFGIFPNSNSALGTSTSARSFNYPTSNNGRQSPNTAFGSPPISSPSFLNGNTTSMLPTPHSPSPLLQNRVASTHFAFPPIWSGASQGQQNGNSSAAYRKNEP